MLKGNNMKIAVLALFNEKDELLCVSRKDNHETYGLIGGKVEENEIVIEALMREVMEETSLELGYADFVYDVLHTENNIESRVYLFAALYDPKYIWRFNSLMNNEGCTLKWMSIHDLIKCTPYVSFYEEFRDFLIKRNVIS